MSNLRKIKDCTIYGTYEKFYNIYLNNQYDSIGDFIDDLTNMSYPINGDTYIIATSLLKKYLDDSQAEYLCHKDINYHSSLLIMISNDNFIYLLEHPEKTFKDVFGTKTSFAITSHIVDMIGKDALKELTFKNE